MSVLRILVLLAAAANLPALAKPLLHVAAPESGIRWQSCLNSGFQRWFDDAPPPGLRCGYVEAPLVYQTHAGHAPPGNGNESVRLALTLLPATGPKKGSLVVIGGGPGLPGINPQLADDARVARLRKSYDIIGYDPRGVGQSTPKISCQLAENDETPSPNDNDIAGAEQQVRNIIDACIKRTGADVLQHIGTDEAVDDLDAIRHALGEPALTAVAYSYGTKVAALYAERYPKKTRALVLDGVVDLAEDDFTQRMNQERGYQQSFLRFAAYCDKTDSCPLPADANRAMQVYHAMLRKLHDHPFVTQAGYEISADDVLTVTRSLLLWPERWHELATLLHQLDAGIAGQQVSDLIDESYSPDADDALNVITCADVADPGADPQRLRRQRQEINTAAMFAHYLPLHEYPLEMCDLWPYRGKDRPHAPVVSPALPPLLFVAQRYDPATPYRNAQVMASRFKSPLITRERDGHTLVLNGIDRCVDESVVDYLLAPKKPRRDKVCR
ncbi:alpha/beta hydrolase [Serratia entomophila]|jgi:pimeloyl-ACP methyl ester carboxylesterase|uniref:Alpha/beta fold hydrolase n=1 Tax=Serratia entomophila TaxID=42906 RepID=A0ABY5CNB1_9GAMM|nr:alpha/beta hydrolase [Serratia entomophila]USU98837.1 alpha/beta fold hydrolase [Serratia entomophila]CAI0806616.1 Tripeptidyl aminopeptidase precursor [Serratia entomophila]CAI0817857.1 Tripeptidyl aminopeptidase precursor [Serratia entomophila]CAI0831145.1 Tripeptidyl aminopeptidase precursor [Serratia entomophila]CAI0873477.1 Tripeptidyl aminopeptidase precursor [Serratia entomophila]